MKTFLRNLKHLFSNDLHRASLAFGIEQEAAKREIAELKLRVQALDETVHRLVIAPAKGMLHD